VVSVGSPGPVLQNRPVAEPHNLGPGRTGFDFASAFGLPARVLNDAAMQALGSYQGGRMLFLELGTGLGSAMIVNGIVEPMEIGHLPYKKGTYEDYVGKRGLDRVGKKRSRRLVKDVIKRLVAATEPQDVVISDGNLVQLKEVPRRCRTGNNAYAFFGCFRIWNGARMPINRRRKKQNRKLHRRREACYPRRQPCGRIPARSPAHADSHGVKSSGLRSDICFARTRQLGQQAKQNRTFGITRRR